MSVKHKGLLGNSKNSSCFHYPVQASNINFNPYIYILYYQSNLLNYLPPNPYIYSHEMGVFEQPGSETRENNVVTISEWRHANFN